VTSGIDLALAIVARMYGLGVARAAARQMEYEWSGPA
jgi:transcriptional regulator GlxA family with amidase domain